MLTRILETFESSNYDFRLSACPQDSLSRLFDQWVPYYRLKAAIATVLAPKSILEIGVRYGYGAAAFLHGAPSASYTGIDLDTSAFGGEKNALAWAEKLLARHEHQIVLGDSQKMARFPGEIYDLIHVDGQQDGDGTYFDLEKALRQGRYILVDGFFWSSENLSAASHFLRQNKSSIEFAVVIPNYAGELLIKTNAQALQAFSEKEPVDSGDVKTLYDTTYYTTDCGGWDTFGDATLSDRRLASLLDLTFVRSPRHVLDLGCGRGEIAVEAARQGCTVTAVDYSHDAISIARELAAKRATDGSIEFFCADATTFRAPQSVDVAVAGDLIEHLSRRELDALYANVSSQLAPDGLFVIHTFPNKWIYQYAYKRRRAAAAALGAYLPPNPRSPYERAMHINEQSPRVLRDQLRRFFPHVTVWLGTAENPAGNLLRPYSPAEAIAERDVFAIAATRPVTKEDIVRLFVIHPLSEHEISNIRLTGSTTALSLGLSARSNLTVTVHNHSDVTLASYGANPVMFAYHWLDANTREVIVFEGDRSRLSPCSRPGTTRKFAPQFTTPDQPGQYILQLTLVQEHVRWFYWSNAEAKIEVQVSVNANNS